jgi:uncharacterized protein involved in exopolysaccharide biosynthesis
MADAPVRAAPVVDYDPLTRSYVASRRWRRFLSLLGFAIAGAVAGHFLSRGSFDAWAYVNLSPPPTTTTWTPADSERDQQAAVKSMLSPASFVAGVASAKINGVTITPTEVSRRLKVRAVPDSRLVEVTGTYNQPEVAAAIVGGVVNNYVASNPNARVVGGPAILAREQLQPMMIVAGAIAGLVGGWIVVTLRKR